MSNLWHESVHADGVVTQLPSASIPAMQRYQADQAVSITDLSTYVILEITGTEATAFLQGQFCNDLDKVSSTQAQISGYCTPKGRLLALPVVLGFDAGYRLLVPGDVADAFIKRLSMFVMRADVAIKQLDDWVALGITAAHDDTLGVAETMLGALPVGNLSLSTVDNAQLMAWHGASLGNDTRSRYVKIAPVEQQLTLWNALDPASRYPATSWRLGDISAGIPSITEGVLEAFVPQMMNLQLIDGLSFTKGCYPGQEIVARMQYLGKLKRHMRVFSVPLGDAAMDMDGALIPGASLQAGSDNAAGVIVDAMPVSDSMALLLAVTKVSIDDALLSVSGISLTPWAMPYALPSLEVA